MPAAGPIAVDPRYVYLMPGDSAVARTVFYTTPLSTAGLPDVTPGAVVGIGPPGVLPVPLFARSNDFSGKVPGTVPTGVRRVEGTVGTSALG